MVLVPDMGSVPVVVSVQVNARGTYLSEGIPIPLPGSAGVLACVYGGMLFCGKRGINFNPTLVQASGPGRLCSRAMVELAVSISGTCCKTYSYVALMPPGRTAGGSRCSQALGFKLMSRLSPGIGWAEAFGLLGSHLKLF